MTLTKMLEELPRSCDICAKKSSKGHQQYWRGYKLHLDVADGQIPISAVLTSASVHDSQVAIALATLTAQRVTSLYDVMDSAYDAQEILEHSRGLGHVPIVDPAHRGAQDEERDCARQATTPAYLGRRETLPGAHHDRACQWTAEGRIWRPLCT